MSQSKAHKLTIRNRNPEAGGVLTGARTEVLLDGVPLKFCTFVKFEVHARKVAKVTLELLVNDIEMEDLEIPELQAIKTKDLTHPKFFTLSSLGPYVENKE